MNRSEARKIRYATETRQTLSNAGIHVAIPDDLVCTIHVKNIVADLLGIYADYQGYQYREANGTLDDYSRIKMEIVPRTLAKKAAQWEKRITKTGAEFYLAIIRAIQTAIAS